MTVKLIIENGKAKFSGRNKEMVLFLNRIKDQPFDEELITAQAKQAGITERQALKNIFFVLGIYHSTKKDLNLQ